MKTNENKKSNKKLLVVAGMAALLALVGYMGGSTFAKYITEQEVETNQATVAKWGYVAKIGADSLFADAYKADVKATHGTADVEVQASSAGLNLVAPGTSGSFDIDVTGTAEVLSKITVDTTFTSDVCLASIGSTDVNYYPVVWTITKTKANVGTTDVLASTTLVNLTTQQMLATLEVLSQASIAPNTVVEYDLTISWAWAFEKGASDSEKAQNNKYDTMLGDLAALDAAALAAKYGTELPVGSTELEFGVKVTVEQLDVA